MKEHERYFNLPRAKQRKEPLEKLEQDCPTTRVLVSTKRVREKTIKAKKKKKEINSTGYNIAHLENPMAKKLSYPTNQLRYQHNLNGKV